MFLVGWRRFLWFRFGWVFSIRYSSFFLVLTLGWGWFLVILRGRLCGE